MTNYGYGGREGFIGAAGEWGVFSFSFSLLLSWPMSYRWREGDERQGGRQRKYIYIGSMNGFGLLSCYFN